jgi:tetratricopeptide (TPR) repeat protein
MYKGSCSKNLRILSFSLSFFLLTSCSSFPRPVQTTHETDNSMDFSKPENPEAYYHMIQAAMHENEGEDEEAEKEYKKALSYSPDSFFLNDQLVDISIRNGDLQGATGYVEKVLRLDPKHVEGLIDLGNAYTVSGNPEKGIELLHRALSNSPDEVNVYFGLATAYASLNQLDQAEQAIRKVISAEPDNAVGYFYLGRLLSERRMYDDAIKAFKTAIDLRPPFEAAQLNLGRTYEQKGDLDQARAVYQSLVDDTHSSSREALGALASVMVKQKSYDEALNLLENWAKKDPNNIDVRLRMGLIYTEQKSYGKAIQAVSWGIDRRPNDVKLRFYRAALYEENKEFDNAKEEYEHILKIDPANVDGRLRLASLYYYRLKQSEPAVSLAKEAMNLDPKRPEPYLVLGLIYYQMENYEKASETFQDGIREFPNQTELHFHLGATYDKLHLPDQMISEMKQVIQIDPRHANALNYLGYTYADKGVRLNEALDLIQRALKIKSNDGYYIDSLAWVYYRMGETQKALDELKKAISLVPDDPVIHEHLGEVYLNAQMMKEAREEWIRSLELDPNNDDLSKRFRSAGFGDPKTIDSIRRAVEKSQSASEKPLDRKSTDVSQ